MSPLNLFTWLVVFESPCGCKVNHNSGIGQYEIEFCPLHQATPDLLDMLEATQWGYTGECPVCFGDRCDGHTDECPVKTTIAKARGVEG